MLFLRVLALLALVFGLASCGGDSLSSGRYTGPAVTSIQVHKAERKMYLLHNGEVLREYDVSLGFTPVGKKQFEGDGKTPEGTYFITHHNPKSRYFLSMGVSYPNTQDRANAAAQGKSPGGDIMIHGRTNYRGRNKGDWTAGCIAVEDAQMAEIYSMVRRNTTIHILP